MPVPPFAPWRPAITDADGERIVIRVRVPCDGPSSPNDPAAAV